MFRRKHFASLCSAEISLGPCNARQVNQRKVYTGISYEIYVAQEFPKEMKTHRNG